MRAPGPDIWRQTWRHDWRELSRSGRGLLVGSLAIVVTGLGLVAGVWWVAFQQEAIDRITASRDAQDAAYRSDAIALVEREEPVGSGAPQHPVSVYWKRAYAWMPPSPAAILAIGQTDLRPYYAVFHGVDPQVLHYKAEVRNPFHLLTGTVDVAFVVTWLLPLLVILLTYDVVSGERDSGRMPLLTVQAARIRGIFIARLLLRTGALVALVALLVVGGLAATRPAALASGEGMQFLLLSSTYIACWAALALAVNTLRIPGWLCGLTLLSIWALVVCLLPTAVQLVAEHRHPVPSRARQIVAAAALRGAVDRDRPGYLARLVEERPDLARPGDPARRPASGPAWYPQFVAYQIALEGAAQADEARVTAALVAQERFADRWRMLSPAMVMSRGAQRIARTSTADLLAFRHAVEDFRARWLEATRGFIFRNEYLAPEDFDALPRFDPSAAHAARAGWRETLEDAGYLGAGALVLFGWALRRLST